MKKNRKIIITSKAPQAVGTYSQGVSCEGMYYFSGQIGLSPSTMEMAPDFEAQLIQVLKNIDGLLEECNLTRSHILKTTIFLTDLGKFPVVNTHYEKYFEKPYPARSTIQVSGLPKGAQVEIEVVAAE